MATESVSILDGNTFAVSDRRGDMEGGLGDEHGFFHLDTRFLSRWVLTIDGKRPNTLSIDQLQYFRAQFFMALTTGTIYVDAQLSVVRQRTIGSGFHEDLTLANHGNEPKDVVVRLEAAADFADLFEVKDQLSKQGRHYTRVDDGCLVLGYERDTFKRETWIEPHLPAESAATVTIDEHGLTLDIHLPPHASVTTSFEVTPNRHARATTRTATAGELSADVEHFLAGTPKLTSEWPPLLRIYDRSLVDLAALRFRSILVPHGAMPAAGLPWFMAMFGRDSLLTSFQALPFVPDLARTTLTTLAALQARTHDAFRDAEPGKILHELRLGEMTAFEERPHSPYYGAADSTPLFLVLLDEYERFTGDRAFVASLERNVRAAIRWIDEEGDRDHDGYIEYERRNVETGLDNQCWKDSWNSIAFANGEIAPTPRATCEIQGYAYDAKRRTARLARLVFGDVEWADTLDREADELKRRFNRDFWIPERNMFALALDKTKRKVDSLTSNIGHLLWSGIVDADKLQACVDHLMGPELFSGWGVRTMGVNEGSYNPIGYHVGTVWPHDTSFIAWGLRRNGFRAEAARLSLGILEAAIYFDHRLPEAFAGYDREVSRFPVEYPTACSPQAWASGAPLLLLRTILGLDVEGEHLIVEPTVPETIKRIELLDIPGRWGREDAFGRSRT